MGTHAYTGGKTDITLSFGFASFNFTSGEFGYLFKKGNSFMETLGYSFGALANIADILVGFNSGSVELRTENDPLYSKAVYAAGNPIIRKDLIGHSQLNTVDTPTVPSVTLVDWGPAITPDGFFDFVTGTNSYES